MRKTRIKFTILMLTFTATLLSVLSAYAGIQEVEERLEIFKQRYNKEEHRIDFVEVESLPHGKHTDTYAQFTAEGVRYVMKYDHQALLQPELLIQDLVFLEGIKNTGAWEYRTKYTLAEVDFNRAHGSLSAAVENLYYQKYSTQPDYLKNSPTIKLFADLSPDMPEKLSVILAKNQNQFDQEIEQTQVLAKKDLRQREKKLKDWRDQTQALEKLEAMSDKLNDLVVKNDRRGVRKMLEAYLPWTVMEPYEASMWRIWLEAIENPDWSKTTVAYRGLDFKTDKVQKLVLPDGKVQVGFLSTVLTKNQGSYTRRLRSLSTNRLSNGKSSFEQTMLMTAQFSAHAGKPKASNFLSFSYNYDIAASFVGNDVVKEGVSTPHGAMLAVKMDSRRLFPNLISGFETEIELLAPLIVFPDEVVAYQEGQVYKNPSIDKGEVDNRMSRFKEVVKKKTGIEMVLPTAETSSLFEKQGIDFFNLVTKVSPTAISCEKVF